MCAGRSRTARRADLASDSSTYALCSKVSTVAAARALTASQLRVDFESRANVGYGFVSFRTVEHLLAFCLLRLGAPWGCFNTAKTLQASYASIQGKESLVAKFRNSAVMSQPEPFRPRVYASHGPRAGLPEEFPPPNDLLRKARSTASILSSQSQSTFG